MKTAFLYALALVPVLCGLSGGASAERILLSCEWTGSKTKIDLEVDNGIVLRDGVSLPNVIDLAAGAYRISFFVDNLASGGLLEKYEIDLRTSTLSWTARKFEFSEAATAVCQTENSFLRN